MLVRSAQGDLRALGTRFAVRQLDGLTRLSVYQHAVAVRPEQAEGEVVIEQGQAVTLDRQRLFATQPLKKAKRPGLRGGW